MIRKKTNQDGKIKYEARVKVANKPLYQRFETRREASNWINEVRFKRDSQIPIHHGKVTIDKMYDKYIEEATARGRAPTTMVRAEETFNQHIKPFFGEEDMLSVTDDEIDRFFSILKKKSLIHSPEKKLSPASINRVRSLLCVFYSVAIRKFKGAFTKNPVLLTDKLPESPAAIQYLNTDEINKFLKSELNSYYYPLWITWLNTGLRIGEVIALQREQIDTCSDLLTVDRLWCRVFKQIRYKTKGGKIRHLGLNRIVQEVLYPVLKEGHIFTKEDGSPLTYAYLSRSLLPQVCKKAEIKILSSHAFRHTYGAQYMMNGGSLWDLQKILGHSDIKITDEYYAHFSRAHVQKRANIISLGSNVIQVEFDRGVA